LYSRELEEEEGGTLRSTIWDR